MTTGFAAGDDQNVHTGIDLSDCVFLCADECRHCNAVLLAHVDHDFRRYAERVRNKADRMRKSDLEQFFGTSLLHVVGEIHVLSSEILDIAGIDVLLFQQLICKSLLGFRNLRK